MKFTLNFKTPDILDQLEFNDQEEQAKAENFARQFLIYSECIKVCFDTEKQTATVIKNE